MVKRKFSVGKCIGLLVGLLLVAALILAGIAYRLATQDRIQEQYTLKNADEGITLTAVKGSFFGRNFEISEDQVNTFINKRFCNKQRGDNSGVDHVMIYFHEDQPCEVYGHAFHKGFAFAFRCKATFDVNPADYGVSVRLYDAYMGELAIPEQMLDLMLQRILEGSEHVHYSGSRSANVLFTAEYTIEIPHTDGLTIGVKEAYSKDGALVCRTNSLTGEALRTAKEYLQSKEGWDSVTDAVDDVKDRIKDKIHNWLSDEDE